MRKIHHARKHISSSEYNRMFDEQGGCCAICHTHQSQLDRKLSVDHNHNTMECRGLLCQSCNVGLGYFRDDKTRLSSALDYLMRDSTGIYLSENQVGKRDSGDWRLLSDEDAGWVSSSSVSNIMKKYSISRSTAFSWKKKLD